MDAGSLWGRYMREQDPSLELSCAQELVRQGGLEFLLHRFASDVARLGDGPEAWVVALDKMAVIAYVLNYPQSVIEFLAIKIIPFFWVHYAASRLIRRGKQPVSPDEQQAIREVTKSYTKSIGRVDFNSYRRYLKFKQLMGRMADRLGQMLLCGELPLAQRIWLMRRIDLTPALYFENGRYLHENRKRVAQFIAEHGQDAELVHMKYWLG